MKKRLTIALLAAAILAPAMLAAQAPAQKEFKVKQRYLNIPVYDDRDSKVLTFTAKGVDTLDVDVCIAPGEPDYWVYKDLTPYMGKKLKLT